MARAVTVTFPESVWLVLKDYEPYPGDVALDGRTRQRLRDASAQRAVTFTLEDFVALGLWLAGVVAAPQAPVEIIHALACVRAATGTSNTAD